jgi:hypothetical protein
VAHAASARISLRQSETDQLGGRRHLKIRLRQLLDMGSGKGRIGTDSCPALCPPPLQGFRDWLLHLRYTNPLHSVEPTRALNTELQEQKARPE